MSRKIHMLSRRDLRIASGGSHYIIRDTVNGVTEYWSGHEVYVPGTTHQASDSRVSISEASFESLRHDARANNQAIAYSQPTAAERLAGSTAKAGLMRVRRLTKRVNKADMSLLTAAL